MKIKLEPINDTNRKAVLALTVREDQPFVAQNDYSLSEADEANARAPGTARPFAIYAGEKIVGFCMLALDPEDENPVDRYCLWRLMIDKTNRARATVRRHFMWSSSISKRTVWTRSICRLHLRMRSDCTCTTRRASGKRAR